jgi:hypothetical protein
LLALINETSRLMHSWIDTNRPTWLQTVQMHPLAILHELDPEVDHTTSRKITLEAGEQK